MRLFLAIIIICTTSCTTRPKASGMAIIRDEEVNTIFNMYMDGLISKREAQEAYYQYLRRTAKAKDEAENN